MRASDAVLRIDPEGRLCWERGVVVEGWGEVRRREVEMAFGASEADGLLALAGLAGEGELPVEVRWWRGLGRRFLTKACHLPGLAGGSGWGEGVPVPGEEELAGMVATAPAVGGMEYLSAGLLEEKWAGMNRVMGERSAGKDVAMVLAAIHPGWRMVGRVTLHLAENRKDAERPFAFLATAARGMDGEGKTQYVPLGQALKDAAAADDKGALQTLLGPLDRAAVASGWLREMVESRRVFQVLAWTAEEAWEFLREIPRFEETGLMVRVPDWWSGGRGRTRVVAQVTVESGGRRGGMGEEAVLRFDVRAAAGGAVLTEAELERIMSSEAPLVSLKGQWVEVDRKKLREAMERWQMAAAANARGIPFHVGMRMLSGLGGGLPSLPAEEEGGWSETVAGGELEARLEGLRGLRDAGKVELPEVPGLLAELRSYQRAGTAWVRQLTGAGMGACLADDMGLGKTLQVIAWLLVRRAEWPEGKVRVPSLLVVPASLLGNWTREIRKFAPGLGYVVGHRSAMEGAEWRRFNEGTHGVLRSGDLVITTYTVLTRIEALAGVEWDAVILDEAQAVKNPGTAQARAVKSLMAGCRVALTGTPVENRLTDLWSLFDFLNPGLLGSAADFGALTKRLEKHPEGMAPLRRLVQPFILRRMKTDPGIAPELPAKTEMPSWCLLSRRQVVLYQRAVNAMAKELAAAEDPVARQGVVLGSLLRLKQICNHPSLFSGDAVYDAADSGKFGRLAEICQEIASRGERVLVFTQFREMTGPLAAHLETVWGVPGLVLHGGTPVVQRQQLVERFQAAGGPPFFVISVKAGGTGLTLTAASHVIHFDRWWNPAVEDQATDRAYRIGQSRPVMVHKFICEGTLEERIDYLIRDKKRLATEVLEDRDGSAGMLLAMSDEELLGMVQLQRREE